MNEVTIQVLLMTLVGTLIGAVVGGGTVMIVYGRAMHSIMNNPVIMTGFEQLAKSWPAPIRDDVAVTGQFLEKVAGGTSGAQTTTEQTTTKTTVTNPPVPPGENG